MTLRDYWILANKRPTNEHIETDTEWFHHIDGATLYLSFQGSISRLDWIQNIQGSKVPYRDMPRKFKVHKGFLKKWRAIREEVDSLVTDQIAEVIIAGFSQGGALAQLAHEDILFNHGIRATTVAFGSPRVFSWGIPKERLKGVVRVQYGGDMVTGLAPWIMGYKHGGQLSTLGKWPWWLRIRPDHHLKLYGYTW